MYALAPLVRWRFIVAWIIQLLFSQIAYQSYFHVHIQLKAGLKGCRENTKHTQTHIHKHIGFRLPLIFYDFHVKMFDIYAKTTFNQISLNMKITHQDIKRILNYNFLFHFPFSEKPFIQFLFFHHHKYSFWIGEGYMPSSGDHQRCRKKIKVN